MPEHLPTTEELRRITEQFPQNMVMDLSDQMLFHAWQTHMHPADREALLQLSDRVLLACLMGSFPDGLEAVVYRENNPLPAMFLGHQSRRWTARHVGRIAAFNRLILNAYREEVPVTVDQLAALGFEPWDFCSLLPDEYFYPFTWNYLQELLRRHLDPKGLFRVEVSYQGTRAPGHPGLPQRRSLRPGRGRLPAQRDAPAS